MRLVEQLPSQLLNQRNILPMRPKIDFNRKKVSCIILDRFSTGFELRSVSCFPFHVESMDDSGSSIIQEDCEHHRASFCASDSCSKRREKCE